MPVLEDVSVAVDDHCGYADDKDAENDNLQLNGPQIKYPAVAMHSALSKARLEDDPSYALITAGYGASGRRDVP